MELLKNPFFVGGIVPMVLFGVYNVLFPVLSQRFSFSEIFIGYGISFLLIGGTTLFLIPENFSRIKLASLFPAFLLGLLLVAINFFMWMGFSHLGGKASELIPIINANIFITVLLAVFFLHEEVVLWKVLLASFLIISGITLLMWKQ